MTVVNPIRRPERCAVPQLSLLDVQGTRMMAILRRGVARAGLATLADPMSP
jgi:hypothetical protein